MSEPDAALWRGTPARAPLVIAWAAATVVAVGLLGLFYGQAIANGICMPFVPEENCTKRLGFRSGSGFGFLSLIAILSPLMALKIAFGYPNVRYSITSKAVARSTIWPFHGTLTQPITDVSVAVKGNSLRFTGTGEKPIRFGPLREGEAETVYQLILDLKAKANP